MAHFIERLIVSNNIFKQFLYIALSFIIRDREIGSHHTNNETSLFACFVFNLKNND